MRCEVRPRLNVGGVPVGGVEQVAHGHAGDERGLVVVDDFDGARGCSTRQARGVTMKLLMGSGRVCSWPRICTPAGSAQFLRLPRAGRRCGRRVRRWFRRARSLQGRFCRRGRRADRRCERRVAARTRSSTSRSALTFSGSLQIRRWRRVVEHAEENQHGGFFAQRGWRALRSRAWTSNSTPPSARPPIACWRVLRLLLGRVFAICVPLFCAGCIPGLVQSPLGAERVAFAMSSRRVAPCRNRRCRSSRPGAISYFMSLRAACSFVSPVP